MIIGFMSLILFVFANMQV